jgi:hypothetical protein
MAVGDVGGRSRLEFIDFLRISESKKGKVASKSLRIKLNSHNVFGMRFEFRQDFF